MQLTFEKGERQRSILWNNNIHGSGDIFIRLGAEYSLKKRKDGSTYMKHYDLTKSPKVPLGLSVILPETLPHMFRLESHRKMGCTNLPKPTRYYRLPYPETEPVQYCHHFVLYPAREMTVIELEAELKNLGWADCDLKASGLPISLLYEDEDDDVDAKLDKVDDHRLRQIHRIVIFSYEISTNAMDDILLLEVRQWILETNPLFEDLLCD
ncbi:hypothetical protein HK099_006468 [Clydaea vesicula]|uniref:Uncharacterized protein n=1 Tax=Clydaea vesicula TaxID=447962 RepID=A0AAD5U5Z4_9FUNG|nr:hypothetical protein HK099_006468 [Clydaea vesicula]